MKISYRRLLALHPASVLLRRLRVFILLTLCLTTLAQAEERQPVNHVILLSVDALLPEYYLPEGREPAITPTLARMREAGTTAQRVYPPYPSLTYPGHATLATGTHPARHGIIANTLFEPTANIQRGAWFARDIETLAIWDIVHAGGLTVGAVLWPVSAQARAIRWNLPEFWSSPYGSEIGLVRRYARPKSLLLELEDQLDSSLFHYLQPADRRDELAALAAIDIFKRHKPNLLLVHFIESDKAQHRYGRGTPENDAVMTRIDAHIDRIWAAVREEQLEAETVLIVLGDHGFADVSRSVGPNVELRDAGFIRLDEDDEIESWDAIINNTGNSAGVYLAEDLTASTRRNVRAILEDFAVDDEGERRYSIVEKDQLVAVGGPRDAAYYLEGAPGVMFTGSLHPSFRDRRASLRGNHGSLPDNPDILTGFLAVGPGIPQGGIIEDMHLVDVAPTIAKLLGLDFPDTDGRVLTELFE